MGTHSCVPNFSESLSKKGGHNTVSPISLYNFSPRFLFIIPLYFVSRLNELNRSDYDE